MRTADVGASPRASSSSGDVCRLAWQRRREGGCQGRLPVLRFESSLTSTTLVLLEINPARSCSRLGVRVCACVRASVSSGPAVCARWDERNAIVCIDRRGVSGVEDRGSSFERVSRRSLDRPHWARHPRSVACAH